MTETARLPEGVDPSRLTDECVELLRTYLTFDTTNPPGDVARVTDWLEGMLRSEGLDPVRLAGAPEKPNLVCTLPGELPPLVLSHHTDVVGAPPERWSVDPFSGELRDGYVYGRGALDMKGYGAMTIVCAIALKRLGVPLRRGLRLLITADEEVGGTMGAKWLAEHHPSEIGGAFMLTEGSFARTTTRGTWYLVEVAQKGVCTVRLTARGTPGHASAPKEDNAVVRIASAVARIGGYLSPPAGVDIARRFLSAFPRELLRTDRPLAELSDLEVEELVGSLSQSPRRTTMLRNTFTPTMVSAGVGWNVVPGECEAYVDCRSLPDVRPEDVLTEIAGVIDDPTIELELVKASQGTASSPDTELFEALRTAILDERPETLVVPFLTSAGTDAKHLRPLGVASYGIIPFELGEAEVSRIHGIDERVSVENLDRGLRILMRTIAGACVR